ncbi:MAG: methionyl-tRNA formyltransferase [Candidatus Fermentibacteraceae bacterium]
MLRLVFLGSSEFAVPVLESIACSPGIRVTAVFTRPDSRAGRGRVQSSTPVAHAAHSLKIPLMRPEKLVREDFEGLEADVMLSAAYGQWLPSWLLESTGLGVVNVHPSLLPDGRGAAPVTRTILAGRELTGVSFMLTDAGWDTGPVIHSVSTGVLPGETAGELSGRLSRLAAEIAPQVLLSYALGELLPVPQKGTGTYAEKISREDAELDWNRPAEELVLVVRAFNPVPGAWCVFNGKVLKVHRAAATGGGGVPGTFSIIGRERITVAAGQGMLELIEVQPESGRRMDTATFLRGLRAGPGRI